MNLSTVDDSSDMKGGASIHLEQPEPKAAFPNEHGYQDDSPRNPRNWPHWKKNVQIVMVAFHSMMSTFTAAGIIPAFDTFAEEYHVSVEAASYLTSFQVRGTSLGLWVYLLITTNNIDFGPRHISPVLETYLQRIRSVSGPFVLCLGKHGLQHRRCSMYLVRCPDGHSRFDCHPNLPTKWYW